MKTIDFLDPSGNDVLSDFSTKEKAIFSLMIEDLKVSTAALRKACDALEKESAMPPGARGNGFTTAGPAIRSAHEVVLLCKPVQRAFYGPPKKQGPHSSAEGFAMKKKRLAALSKLLSGLQHKAIDEAGSLRNVWEHFDEALDEVAAHGPPKGSFIAWQIVITDRRAIEKPLQGPATFVRCVETKGERPGPRVLHLAHELSVPDLRGEVEALSARLARDGDEEGGLLTKL